MCGIAGAFGPRLVLAETEDAVLTLLEHRGPDGRGRFHGRLRGLPVTLLATRLAVVDLDPRADQPFVAGDCALVFNGEVYNHPELRRELEDLGHTFHTRSDTEVVLRAWNAWGPNCVDRFEGMWALALLDQRAGRLFLSRDRFGEKPLYTLHEGGTLYFASEIKALAALSGTPLTPNLDHVRRYLVNGYKALHKAQDTFFHEVRAFPPASRAVVADPARVRPQRFWRLRWRPRPMTADAAAEGVRERLQRAVALRLRADVPIAFCLSGGVDSGALACLAACRLGHDVRAFSIVDRDPRYDESEAMRATVAAIGCDHHVIPTVRTGFLDRLERQVRHREAPVAPISSYLHGFLSEAIHDRGFKVAVSGTGADELFTGYYDHYGFWLAEMRKREDFAVLVEDWRRGYGASVRNPLLKDPLAFVRDPRQRAHIFLDRELFNGLMTEPVADAFTEAHYADGLLRNRMLNELFHECVPVVLDEDDMNSMRVSVENRSPYLDRELVEFAYTVPNQHLVRDGRLKWLLRAAVAGALPDAVRLERRKRGFNASIVSLLDVADAATRECLLAPGPIFDLIDRRAFARFLDGDFGDNSRSKFLFSFVSAKFFLESDLATRRRAAAEAA